MNENEELKKQDEIRIRVSKKEKEILQSISEIGGFESLSDFIRSSCLSNDGSVKFIQNPIPTNKLIDGDNNKLQEIFKNIDICSYKNIFAEDIVLVVSKETEKSFLKCIMNSNMSIVTVNEYLNGCKEFEGRVVLVYPSLVLYLINENLNLRQDNELLSVQNKELMEKVIFDIEKHLGEHSVKSSLENLNDILMFACSNEWNIEINDLFNVKYTSIKTNLGDEIIFLYDKQKEEYYLRSFLFDKNNSYKDFIEYLLTLDISPDIECLLIDLGYTLEQKEIVSIEKVKYLLDYLGSKENSEHWIIDENKDSCIVYNKKEYFNINVQSKNLSICIKMQFTIDFNNGNIFGYEMKSQVEENNEIEWNNHNDLKKLIKFLNSDSAYAKLNDKIVKLSNRNFEKLLIKKKNFSKVDYNHKLQIAIARSDFKSIEKYLKYAPDEVIRSLSEELFSIEQFYTTRFYANSLYGDIEKMKKMVELFFKYKTKINPISAILYSIYHNDMDVFKKAIGIIKSGIFKEGEFNNEINKNKPLYKKLLNDNVQTKIALNLTHLFDYNKVDSATEFINKLNKLGYIFNVPLIVKQKIYTDEMLDILFRKTDINEFQKIKDEKTDKNEYMKDEDVDKIIENIKNGDENIRNLSELLYDDVEKHQENIEILEYEKKIIEEEKNKEFKVLKKQLQ